MTEIYNEIKNRQKDNNSSGFDTEEFLKSLDIDKTQDIDNNFPDKTQPVVVEPQQIEPQRKSYFLQNSQKEINTTAQQPNEIEYEADIIDNPKNKDNYFGLTKLEKDKPSIFKAALESATKYNPLTTGVAVKNKLNEITGKNDIELSLEAGRGFAASGVDFGSAVYRFFKQNIDIAKTYTKEQLDRIANKANVIAYGKEKGDFSAKIDEKYNNFYKQIEEENKYLKDKTEKFLEYSGLAKDDNDSFVYDLAGGGASLLFALGLVALTKSPAVAAELFGAYQYQSLYEESIEKGFSPIKARSIGVLGGAAEAGLEMFGLHTLIETLKAKRSFTKIAKSFVIELTQEASQQTAEEMLAKWTGLRDSTAGQIWHNIWYAGIIGGILGGGAGAIGNIVVKATDELVENGADKQKAQKAVETVIEAALSQETADEIKQIDKDEQSPVTYTNADPRETYREFGDTVKNVLKSDQARGAEKKLLELKQSKYEERKKHYLEQGLSQDEAEKQAQAEATMYDVMARNRYESGEDLESIYNDIQIQQAKQEAANNGFDTTVPEIKQKWDDAKKIGGDSDTKYMNDNVIDGQYFLVEAETPTASHNPNANFQPTTGFPQTADGKTVNDRDYFNDKQAQAIVITTAQNYDSRAIDDMPIVSFEGVVVSGNQRTMASQLAAQNNTDGKYIEYLYNHCKKFGFSPEQVAEFKHPRVVFVPNESLDYDTQTFAAFNASEKKTQGSVEKAVSLGKRINDETIEQIANIIDKFDTLAQLHDSPKDIKEIVRILSKENIINNNELASLTDTTSAGDLKFSAIGKDFLENLLLGTALKEQTIRDLTHLQAIRAKLVKCILPLVKNKALPKEYQLQDDIEQATRILTAMKKENFKTIADFTAQQELFGSNIEYDKNIKKLAHLLTLKYSDIKSVLASYNQQAADNGAYGNSGLFGDSVQQTKNDILDDIFNNNKEFADVFFQQGYHGGGKDFDNFDLNFVLTGEGYNVHGWGVYVTANKKIAEDYRKRLSDHNSYHTFIYNGKKYTNKQIAQFKALSLFKQFGKKQALKTMNEILNNKEYWQYYGNDTKNIEAAIDLIKGIDRQSQIKETYGQTYKVDIPDNDVLLDEQKYFKEQPAKVQEALRKIGDNLTDEQIENLGYNSKEQKQVEAAKKFYKDMVFNNDYTGQGIYETITGLTGGDTKQASLLLKQYGIKGITYYGKIDGRGYVIFDDKAINILETYYQNNQSPRGATTVYDRQYYVDLFSNSDKSTLMHELAHIYLADLNRLAKKVSASKKVRDLKEQIDLFLGEPENDGRYSTEQQEKFAINFESYLKNGQAPNAKLKNVFERFAKWLADIYDTIKDSLPTINNEVKSLFDKILSDSYFVPDSNIYGGKAEAIKKVIENIKQGINSEVDGITITDVERLLKVAYTRKPNKPSKNLLQLLKSKNIYDFNDLDKAGNKRVQEILKANGYIDDKVTEEQAVELAKAALDGKPVYRLADNWRTRSDTDFRRNLRILEEVIDFNDIDMVLAKIYDLQNAGYRQVEQQDVEQAKQAAQQVNSASLDNAKKIIKEVIEKIRRKQFIDSAAKKELLQDLESSQTIEEIRESVGNIIEDLQAEVDLIKDSIKTQRKPKIRKDKTIPPGKNATQEEKNAYKKYMKVRIDRLLKQALPRKQNQQKFSKFDVQTQRFFNNLQVWNNKTLVEIQQVLYDKAMNINDEQGEGLDNFSKIENMFLSYKAHKVTYHSVDFYKQLYDSLQEINVFGRNTKDIENTLKKEQALQDRQDLIDNIEKNKSSNAVTTGVKKQYIKWLGNWYSTINAIAGKGQAEKDSLEKIEIDIFNANYKKTEDVKEKCKNALGLKNTSDLDMVINNYLKEEYTYSETDAEGYTNNIKLNKMQLICCYIWLKNDTLKDRIIRAFGNMQVMDMINKLTLQDQKFGDELQQAVADLYDDINKVYLKMYGLDLPQAQNYFPSNVERIQGNMDLLKDNIAMVSSPGFIKARVDSHLPLMNFGNPVKIALDHIAKVNHFVYMQEKLAQLNKIYKATIVKRHIVNNYGDRVYAYILQVLDNAKFQTVARTIDGISDIGNYLVNNYVLTKIAIKPSIMIKQLLSCINYIEDIDSTKWFSGFLKGISSPKETIKFMMTNSKYCKARFEKGGQTEALLKAIEGQNATFAKVKTFKGMLSYMTRVGDIGAIIFGGYPMIQAQLEKGIDLKTAIENFEKATVRSQQASLPSTLSNWQYRGMNSWLYRAFFAFSNTPNQYCRKMADSMYMYYHGDIDKKQLAKNLMIYGVFNPLLYTSFTSLALLTGIVSGDWDDLADDIIMSLLQCSNVLALPFIAQGYNIFVSRVVAGKWLPDKEIPLLDNLVKIMKTYSKDELEFNDWLNITDEAGSLVLGVPVKTLYNEFVGSIKDLLDGEYGKFIVKVYGATESRANKIFD